METDATVLLFINHEVTASNTDVVIRIWVDITYFWHVLDKAHLVLLGGVEKILDSFFVKEERYVMGSILSGIEVTFLFV